MGGEAADSFQNIIMYQPLDTSVVPVVLKFLIAAVAFLKPNLTHPMSAVRRAAAGPLAVVCTHVLHAPRNDLAAAPGFETLKAAARSVVDDAAGALEGAGKLVDALGSAAEAGGDDKEAGDMDSAVENGSEAD